MMHFRAYDSPSLLLLYFPSCVGGNIRYREYAVTMVVRYSRSETHSEKNKIAKSILFALKSLNPPSRFLERDSETKMWHEISDKMALQKIAHRIRDTKRLMLRQGRKAMLRREAKTRSHRPILTRMQSERTPR
mmetsp:Transcript_24243/g.43880  ORF Transcript_24243/g.43880 Transcript_24243/m.43880 type:complete len:133 (+) Transcript_24243:756-1154(+)